MGQRVDAPKLLRQKAYCGLKRKVSTISQKYIDRMEYELNTIIDMGYADYILIVADYVQEGKRIAKINNPYKMGYGVGPGRGSGAGSLVNYCMGITALDPLEDWDGLASCIVFAQHYKQVQKYIKDGNVIKVYGYFNKQDEESFSNELIARQIFPCHPYSNHVFISFQSRTEWPDVCQSLKPYLVEQGHPVIFYECDNGSIREHLQFKIQLVDTKQMWCCPLLKTLKKEL